MIAKYIHRKSTGPVQVHTMFILLNVFVMVVPLASYQLEDVAFISNLKPSECNTNISIHSLARLWSKIYTNAVDFVRLELLLEDDISPREIGNYNRPNDPRKWILTNQMGKTLLTKDYRFDAFALGTFKESMESITVNMTYDKACFLGLPLKEQYEIIVKSLRQNIYGPTDSVSLEQGSKYLCFKNYLDLEKGGLEYPCDAEHRHPHHDDPKVFHCCRRFNREVIEKWEPVYRQDFIAHFLCQVIGFIVFLNLPLTIKWCIPPEGTEVITVKKKPLCRCKTKLEGSVKYVAKHSDISKPLLGTDISAVTKYPHILPPGLNETSPFRKDTDTVSSDVDTAVPTDKKNKTPWCVLGTATPVNLTKLPYFILFHSWSCSLVTVIRRTILVLAIPSYIYFYMAADLMYYNDEFKARVTFGDKELIEVEWLFSDKGENYNIMLIIFLYIYVFAAALYAFALPLVFKNETTSWTYRDNGTLFGQDIPGNLRVKVGHGSEHAITYNHLIHRAALIVNPDFWSFWLKIFRPSNMNPVSSFFKNKVLNAVVLYCLLLLFMPIALTPLGAVCCQILHKHANPDIQNHNGNARKWLKFLKFLMLLLAMFLGVAAVITFLIIPTVHLLALIVSYTVSGLLLNYNTELPRAILALAAISCALGLLSHLEEPFHKINYLLQEECERFTRDYPETKPEILQHDEGKIKVPKDLLERCYSLVPSVHVMEFKVVIKIILLVVIIKIICLNMASFHLYDDKLLGQVLVSAVIVWIPRVLSRAESKWHGFNEEMVLRQRVTNVIQRYLATEVKP